MLYYLIIQELLERKRREFEHIAVFPCKLRIMPNCIFNTRDPIVVGVVIEAGIIKPGTPLTVPSKSVSQSFIYTSLLILRQISADCAVHGHRCCIEHRGEPQDSGAGSEGGRGLHQG